MAKQVDAVDAAKYLEDAEHTRAADTREHKETQARQIAWLKRGTMQKVTTQAPWRPKKIYRLATKKWLLALDNAFKQPSGKIGLAYFWEPPNQNWRLWPHATIGMDLGSDGNCGFFAAERKYKLNVDQFNDPSHGLNRDWALACKGAGLWNFALCWLISLNLPYGPHKNDERRFQIRSAMTKLYTSGIKGMDLPLYAAFASEIIDELEDLGVVFDGPEPKEEQAFEWMCSNRGVALGEGRRINTCRFLGLPHGITTHISSWHIDLSDRLYVSLELDFLGNRALQEKLVLEHKVGDGEICIQIL